MDFKLLKGLIIVFIVLLFSSCRPSVEELTEAIIKEDIEKVTELINNGVLLNSEEIKHQPLDLAIVLNNLEIVKLLVENGVDVNWLNKKEETPLHTAFYKEHWQIFEYLIENGANVNIQVKFVSPFNEKEDEDTLASWAAFNKNEVYVKLFIDNGLDINYQDPENGATLLHYAVNLLSFILYCIRKSFYIIEFMISNYHINSTCIQCKEQVFIIL